MLTFLKAWFTTRIASHLPTDEKGQDAAEYGLLVAGIAVLIVAAVAIFGGELVTFFTGLGAQLGL